MRKEFTTAIIFEPKYGDVRGLTYQPDAKMTPCLTVCAWLSRKEVLVMVQDPYIYPVSKENPHPLWPPPETVRNAEDTD